MGLESKYFIDPLGEAYDNDAEKLEEIDTIRSILKRQKDRGYCSFEFVNNLKHKVDLKYLKISHVLFGHETFVYEVEDLKNGESFVIRQYAIGVDVGNETESVLHLVRSEREPSRHDVCDKIYVQFVIHINGEDRFYHHCYEEAVRRVLHDFFRTDGKVSQEYLNLVQIRMFFDPFYNDLNEDELKLRISVSNPLQDSITMVSN